MLDRERESREQSTSAAVIDSQLIKAPAAEMRRLDAGKKIVGRKRHIAVNISDRAGAQAIVAAFRKRWPLLKHLFADGAYDSTRLMDAAYRDFVLEIVRRTEAATRRERKSIDKG